MSEDIPGDAPATAQSAGRLRRWVSGVLAALILSGGVVLWDVSRFLHAPLPAGVAYTVEPGSSIRRVARDLQGLGWLTHPFYWIGYARLTGRATRVQAGEYEIPAGETPAGLLQRLTNGRVKLYGLTLIEGWTFVQLREALARHPVLRQTLNGRSDAEIMQALGADGEHPEGRFLPDTYLFPRQTSDLEFLRRAYASMQSTLEQEWRVRSPDSPLADTYETLILASIVERETAVAEERPAIAGVMIERLKRNMYLQTDPTVIYGMGASFTGNIRFRDLRRDTPYNTYTRKGLPPTPIAMPSREAIRAVLHPEFTGALYFVARGDGTHHFSRTLSEHNAAVERYQLHGKRRRSD